MINNWVEVIGDCNFIYVDDVVVCVVGYFGIVVLLVMIQVWIMMGLGGVCLKDDLLGFIIKLFDDVGYIGVVVINCEQIYYCYLLFGE